MSAQGSSQSMTSPTTRVRSQLECPVCFNIPRDLPLPSCPSGHFVCRICKTRVMDCPTCRQPMPANMTNSVVGALIEEIQHKCKYNDQGCKVKLMLKDLVAHEKNCSERTFTCPFSGCNESVKLRFFDVHALGYQHSALFERNNFAFDILENDKVRRRNWRMGYIQALDEHFHVNLIYDPSSLCLILTLWIAKNQKVASKYTANLVIKGGNSKLCFDGIQVCSVENVPSIDRCLKGSGKTSLCFPKYLAMNMSVKKREDVGIVEYLNVEVSFRKI